ncbi:MAG: acetyl-CoA C-acyltransferase [Ilumatobacteraceae bacterium]|jgi:acetyl-CoA acyltransferase|nr:acetyl-CoA C-acyltransferase [Acidimicrobiaceae bacterium]MBP6488100.1 acetyl-CoA C-acyltransferase [Ilumatobacteraceae bacterium]MBP7888541.1 acetyl-CoA C-acyltransferase [Ilumatobacteraceae bacterium]MBP8208398.1 acetyl-CoA C-acyltransferase [Ilumatobacteraceae bacterium]MBP9052905.1 acetyl-CoA C-acyltransferase [Ilumatobacteraceae bacterium]
MSDPNTTAVIVDAVRTPLGRRNGKLKDWHPVDLAGETLKALQERTGIDPGLVDDVIMGCVMQVGEQAVNVGRNAVLAAGWPEHVPGTTIDRQCGSSQQAAHFAAQGVIAGAYDIVVAAGVEVMTRVPMGSSMADGKFGFPFGPAVGARYAGEGGLVPQGISAEMIADKWGLTRDDLDAFGVRSQEFARRATDEGRFQREILPLLGSDGALMSTDEGLRDTTLESLAKLKPAFRAEEEGGRVTAGNSSQITDGASAMLIMSEAKAKQLGLTPRARFVNFSLAGDNPRMMLTAPIPATQKVLARAGLTMDDMDLTEINEAFACVVLAWAKELHPNMDTVNVNGGAIALGHPLGASGARLMTTLLCELERTGGRYGLQTMCEGGGMANATIIERLG